MKRAFLTKLPLLVLTGALVLTVVTFAQNSSGSNTTSNTDTIPKKQKQVRDLDEALLELDRGEEELQKALREIDSEKIEKEIRAAMKNLEKDMAKMNEDIAKAMKEIDMEKINLQVQKELQAAQKELKEVDMERIRKEVAESLEKVDMNKIKIEMNKVKEIDMSKMKKELEKIGPQIEKSLESAKKDIEKARKELTAYKNLVDALDRDGLLKKNQDYKVEYKNNELTVNGKKLSASETKKYSEFLTGKDNFTIQKEDDDFNIHNK